MSVISLSSNQPRNAKPLNVAALWSDDLELPILESQQQLTTQVSRCLFIPIRLILTIRNTLSAPSRS